MYKRTQVSVLLKVYRDYTNNTRILLSLSHIGKLSLSLGASEVRFLLQIVLSVGKCFELGIQDIVDTLITPSPLAAALEQPSE